MRRELNRRRPRKCHSLSYKSRIIFGMAYLDFNIYKSKYLIIDYLTFSPTSIGLHASNRESGRGDQRSKWGWGVTQGGHDFIRPPRGYLPNPYKWVSGVHVDTSSSSGNSFVGEVATGRENTMTDSVGHPLDSYFLSLTHCSSSSWIIGVVPQELRVETPGNEGLPTSKTDSKKVYWNINKCYIHKDRRL